MGSCALTKLKMMFVDRAVAVEFGVVVALHVVSQALFVVVVLEAFAWLFGLFPGLLWQASDYESQR